MLLPRRVCVYGVDLFVILCGSPGSTTRPGWRRLQRRTGPHRRGVRYKQSRLRLGSVVSLVSGFIAVHVTCAVLSRTYLERDRSQQFWRGSGVSSAYIYYETINIHLARRGLSRCKPCASARSTHIDSFHVYAPFYSAVTFWYLPRSLTLSARAHGSGFHSGNAAITLQNFYAKRVHCTHHPFSDPS